MPAWRNNTCKGLETSKGRSSLDHKMDVKWEPENPGAHAEDF